MNIYLFSEWPDHVAGPTGSGPSVAKRYRLSTCLRSLWSRDKTLIILRSYIKVKIVISAVLASRIYIKNGILEDTVCR